MSPLLRAAVEDSLMQVVDNVLKHVVQRDGWHTDDKCFKMDLREAQDRIEAACVAQVLAEREACAKLADEAATRMLPAEDVNNATAARFQARQIAAAIRARSNS